MMYNVLLFYSNCYYMHFFCFLQCCGVRNLIVIFKTNANEFLLCAVTEQRNLPCSKKQIFAILNDIWIQINLIRLGNAVQLSGFPFLN